MQLTLSGKPVHKARPRFARTKKGVITYDSQAHEKNYDKSRLKSQMAKNGYKTLCSEPIHITLVITTPYPKKCSRAQKNAKFNVKKPDLDNFIKYYSDVMNQIVFKDDSQVCSIQATKTYSENPGVLIQVYQMEEKMAEEHAISYKEQLSNEQLEYIVQKANKLGKIGRSITSVSIIEENDSKHVMFKTNQIYENDKEEL